MGAVSEFCQSFVLDNGAFTVWKSGGTLDVDGFTEWARLWSKHPGFDWALIPDVIEGDEADNDALIEKWVAAGMRRYGVPVWHLHESAGRLARLCNEWPTVALGSSGKWSSPGVPAWWDRMGEAMDAICDEHGRPPCRLHGLRMLDHEIFSKLPLASADSTNAAVNSGSVTRFGIYTPATSSQRAAVIADRVESHNSSPVWKSIKEEELQLT